MSPSHVINWNPRRKITQIGNLFGKDPSAHAHEMIHFVTSATISGRLISREISLTALVITHGCCTATVRVPIHTSELAVPPRHWPQPGPGEARVKHISSRGDDLSENRVRAHTSA